MVWSQDHSTVLAESRQAIGHATNNVAEYRGLIAGLEEAAGLGADEVEVSMDSKLVVEQMAGRWKVKNSGLADLHRQARALAERFDSVTYRWIPRSQNAHADRLANEAMDAAADPAAMGRAADPAAMDAAADSAAMGRAVDSAAVDAAADPAGSSADPATPTSTEGRTSTHTPVNPAGWTGARGVPTRLLLLRHGQTGLSVEKRYSGRGNPELTELGRRQADAAADYLAARGGITAVVSSPLQRARDTAAASAKALGLDVTVDEDLTETDFGQWEGLTFGEASASDPETHGRWLRDTSVAPPGGESFDAVATRVRRARNRIIAEYGGATVLVVSHVTPIKTMLRMALDAGPTMLYRLHLDLASLSIAEFYPDGVASVRLVNQTAYL